MGPPPLRIDPDVFLHIPGDRAKLGRQPLRVCQNRVSYLHSLELWTLPRSWLLAVTELASLACRPAGGPVHGAYITFLKFAYFVRHTWLYKMSYLPLKIFWELWFPWSIIPFERKFSSFSENKKKLARGGIEPVLPNTGSQIKIFCRFMLPVAWNIFLSKKMRFLAKIKKVGPGRGRTCPI